MSVYTQLAREQRYQISALLKTGHNQTEFAQELLFYFFYLTGRENFLINSMLFFVQASWETDLSPTYQSDSRYPPLGLLRGVNLHIDS